MKTIKFTDDEIEALKDMLNSYISYMLASGASEKYIEVVECKSLIKKIEKGMMEQEIKQKAEEYAEQNKVNFSEDKNFEIYDDEEQKEAYIAGAYSMLPKIEELEKRIKQLEKGE